MLVASNNTNNLEVYIYYFDKKFSIIISNKIDKYLQLKVIYKLYIISFIRDILKIIIYKITLPKNLLD